MMMQRASTGNGEISDIAVNTPTSPNSVPIFNLFGSPLLYNVTLGIGSAISIDQTIPWAKMTESPRPKG
jgi:hypothetical protein